MINIKIVEGIDKVGKTTWINKQIQEFEKNGSRVLYIKNPNVYNRNEINKVNDIILKASAFSADITYNMFRLKDYLLPKSFENNTTIFIDRWYFSTWAYQMTELSELTSDDVFDLNYRSKFLVKLSKEQDLGYYKYVGGLTIEDFTLQTAVNFIDEITKPPYTHPNEQMNIEVYYFIPDWDLIEQRLNNEKSKEKYEKLNFLQMVDERYRYLFNEMLSNILDIIGLQKRENVNFNLINVF